MIKRLSLMLALLLLLSMPVFSAYSESGDDYSEDTDPNRSVRRIPAEEKSLAYWEQTRVVQISIFATSYACALRRVEPPSLPVS